MHDMNVPGARAHARANTGREVVASPWHVKDGGRGLVTVAMCCEGLTSLSEGSVMLSSLDEPS